MNSGTSKKQAPKPLPNKDSKTSHTLHTLHTFTNTTQQEGGVKNDFEKEFSELFAKYESRLALYTVRSKCYVNDELADNPKLEKIKKAITEVPISKIEAGIKAFLVWIRDAKNVRDPYKALEQSILRGWEV